MKNQDIYFAVKGIREINGEKWIEISEQTAVELLEHGEKDIFILKTDNGEYFCTKLKHPNR